MMHDNDKSNLSIVAAIAFALATVAAIILLTPSKPPLPAVTLPIPNGYETLAEAGALTVALPDDFDETTDVETLRACVNANAKAFDLIDQASTEECAVPINYDAGMQGVVDAMNGQQIRPAMRLLIVKSRLAELEGDLDTAVATHLSLLHHAEKIANEGLLVHLHVSLAYQTSAVDGLSRLAPKLDPEQRAACLAILQSTPRQPINVDAIQARDEALSFRNSGIVERWQFSRMRKQAAPTYQKTRAQCDMLEVKLQEVMALLAE